ncbi:hypothetical protein BXOR1_13505 [Xanthomonas oryzae pv. oryzicola]|nr:hypothetical protein FE36_20400 [Xanthomonas oryzae pv. oryzicola]AKO09373.1 hypothetical protein ACU17_16410 [Xanthomonas oryzae pv. oryzicola]KOR40958.1 hypothetical protein ADT27_19925 [Xanthomonas oryzae]OLK87976.1 hypothetical protein BXOR1_13505 [Xanthomonas oryzae pv. oryzicola]
MLGIIWFRKVWLDLPEVTLELYSELIVIPLPSFLGSPIKQGRMRQFIKRRSRMLESCREYGVVLAMN